MTQGQELERKIRTGMGAADIRGMAALARRAGVQRDTLYAWFRGDQEPRPDTLARVAEVLGLRLSDLWNYAPETPSDPLLLAINRQTAALERTCARLVEISAAQEQGLRDLAQAIADAIRKGQTIPPVEGDSDDAVPVSSGRDQRT